MNRDQSAKSSSTRIGEIASLPPLLPGQFLVASGSVGKTPTTGNVGEIQMLQVFRRHYIGIETHHQSCERAGQPTVTKTTCDHCYWGSKRPQRKPAEAYATYVLRQELTYQERTLGPTYLFPERTPMYVGSTYSGSSVLYNLRQACV